MKLIALGNSRLSSIRCKNKMIRPFANTNLTELAVKRLVNVKEFDEIYFAAYDENLLSIARNHLSSSSIIERSRQSAYEKSSLTRVHDYLLDIEFDYCMWVNSCHTFLKPETIDKAAIAFRNGGYKSMTAVIERKTWFYKDNGKPINNKNPTSQAFTEKSSSVYEVVHAFHVFEKDHFFKTSSYWKNDFNDPYLYPIKTIEAIDIDSEDDFMVSETLYKGLINY